MTKMGRPPNWTDPAVLEAEGMAFINYCKANDEPVTITGLALALNTTRATLMDYEEKDDFLNTVKRLKLHCENYAEKHMFTGKNPTGAIFALKNYNWRDQQHVDQTTNGKDLPTPLLHAIRHNISDTEAREDEAKD
jgi:DNA-packaging protein gp3